MTSFASEHSRIEFKIIVIYAIKSARGIALRLSAFPEISDDANCTPTSPASNWVS